MHFGLFTFNLIVILRKISLLIHGKSWASLVSLGIVMYFFYPWLIVLVMYQNWASALIVKPYIFAKFHSLYGLKFL